MVLFATTLLGETYQSPTHSCTNPAFLKSLSPVAPNPSSLSSSQKRPKPWRNRSLELLSPLLSKPSQEIFKSPNPPPPILITTKLYSLDEEFLRPIGVFGSLWWRRKNRGVFGDFQPWCPFKLRSNRWIRDQEAGLIRHGTGHLGFAASSCPELQPLSQQPGLTLTGTLTTQAEPERGLTRTTRCF